MLRPALLTLGLLTLATGCTKNEPPKDPWLTASNTAAEQLVLPAYTRWVDASRQLADSARSFCSGEQSLADARKAYREVFTAWAAVQPMAFGPLAEGNLAWQVQFWPDKKNLVARQVNELVDSNPNLRSADLEKASVVVQGLTAYEYLLFDADTRMDDQAQKVRYCPLLLGIASHQQKLSAGVLGQWLGEKGLASQLRQFPNPRYPEAREAVAELLRTEVTALDALKKKLGQPLAHGNKGAPPQPYLAEAWRSELSLASLDATLASAQRLWRGPEGSGLHQLVPASEKDLVSRMDGAWQETRQRLAALDQPLGKLLTTPAGRDSLEQLYESLDRLHRLQGSELARALNIPLGFNAHDGD